MQPATLIWRPVALCRSGTRLPGVLRVLSRRRAAAYVALIVLVAVSGGCGSRRSHEELLAATSRLPASAGPSAVGSSGTAPTGPGTGVAENNAGRGAALTGSSSGSTDVAGDPAAGGARDQSGGQGRQCSGTEAPITIASVGHQSGVLGATMGGGPKAVSAWAAWINARGGVSCHQVRHIVADDGGDPARHQALVQQLVEEDGVIAFVQQNAPLSGPSSVPYLERVRVPVIGSEAAQPQFYTSQMFFPQGASDSVLLDAAVRAAARAGVAKGFNTMAILSCVEVPQCSRFGSVGQQVAPEEGVSVVYVAQASIVAPDYTSQCQQAQQRGAQVFFVGVDVNSIQRLLRSCDSIGYHPLYQTGSIAMGNALAAVPSAEGLGGSLGAVPWMLTDRPQVAEYLDVLARYAPGLEPSADTIAGWTSAKLFEKAAQDLPANPTSADVLTGLWAIHDDDLGGLTYPLTFTQGNPAPMVECWFTATISNGAWTSPDGGKLTCK